MESNMTAVEWLIAEISNSVNMPFKHFDELKEEAKEMEKQQIENAYESGIEEGINRYSSEEYNLEYYETAEKYFNETFNK